MHEEMKVNVQNHIAHIFILTIKKDDRYLMASKFNQRIGVLHLEQTSI
jgi:hypothetical protein